MINLSSDNGGAGNNYGAGPASCAGTFTLFDSDVPTLISTPGLSAPFAGSFAPEESLDRARGPRQQEGHERDMDAARRGRQQRQPGGHAGLLQVDDHLDEPQEEVGTTRRGTERGALGRPAPLLLESRPCPVIPSGPRSSTRRARPTRSAASSSRSWRARSRSRRATAAATWTPTRRWGWPSRRRATPRCPRTTSSARSTAAPARAPTPPRSRRSPTRDTGREGPRSWSRP